MTNSKQIDVILDDRTPHKWILPLTEDAFQGFFISKGSSPIVVKVFGAGSLFSPMLFGKFFDPSDAFPLWDLDADVLLSNLRRSGHRSVDWSRTDKEYVFKAELPGAGVLLLGEDTVQVCLERGKVLEISGLWKQERETTARDWRSSHWWEHGYVRRLELPEDADWKKTDAALRNDKILEIKIPFNFKHEIHQGSNNAESMASTSL
ncbi:hypothetical protein Dimus_012566 [Dionaea muscipula]